MITLAAREINNTNETGCIKKIRTTFKKPAAIFSTNLLDNSLNLSLLSKIIHLPYNCQSFTISKIEKGMPISLLPCLNSFQSCIARILVIIVTIGST